MEGSRTSRPQFVVDEKGKRIAVLLDLKLYEELLEAAEELDDIRAYDEAEGGEAMPFEQAIKEIEDMRE